MQTRQIQEPKALVGADSGTTGEGATEPRHVYSFFEYSFFFEAIVVEDTTGALDAQAQGRSVDADDRQSTIERVVIGENEIEHGYELLAIIEKTSVSVNRHGYGPQATRTLVQRADDPVEVSDVDGEPDARGLEGHYGSGHCTRRLYVWRCEASIFVHRSARLKRDQAARREHQDELAALS